MTPRILFSLLLAVAGADADNGTQAGRFTVEHLWIWRPFGTDEIWVGGGCSGTIKSKRGKKRRTGCGIQLGREGSEAPISLGFVDTDRWQPTLSIVGSSRDVFLYGGDEHGAFRRTITYDGGKITLGEKARKKDGKGDVYE